MTLTSSIETHRCLKILFVALDHSVAGSYKSESQRLCERAVVRYFLFIFETLGLQTKSRSFSFSDSLD